MAKSKFRVGGGYTTINFNNQPVMYVDLFRETAPRPVAAPQPIQPLDEQYPIEIALPHALEAGTLELTIREQWDQEVWATLPGGYFDNANDLLDVFKAQLQAGTTLGSEWSVTKIIYTPGNDQVGSTTNSNTIARSVHYSGIVIVNVMVDETVQVSTMTFPKTIQMMYLRRTEAKSDLSTPAT